jgi:uncharacterized protein YecT (DUF1311 family)
MTFFIKMLLLLLFSFQWANAIDWKDYTLDNCDGLDNGDKDKCIFNQYQSINERLDEVYKQVVNSLPYDKKVILRQKQRAWLKERNKLCNSIYEDNCYMDETMKKIEELSELDKQINKHKFEGKWEASFVSDYKYLNGEEKPIYTTYHYFLIENGENICGTWGINANKGKALFVAEDSLYARSVKICGYMHSPCENSNKTKAFADWDTNNDKMMSAVTYEQDHIRTRTPFTQTEKEKLIRENKWLQDCLSYKGE